MLIVSSDFIGFLASFAASATLLTYRTKLRLRYEDQVTCLCDFRHAKNLADGPILVWGSNNVRDKFALVGKVAEPVGLH